MTVTLLAGGCGVLVGAALAVVGAGGTVLLLPLLILVVGVEERQAMTDALAIVAPTAAAAAILRSRHGLVCWACAALVGGASIVTAWVGTRINGVLPDRVLLVLLGVLCGWAALAMWRRAGKAQPSVAESCPVVRRREGAAAGGGLGILTGTLGVGGGFFVLPILVGVLKVPPRLAVGTSLVVIATSASAALVSRAAAGTAPGGHGFAAVAAGVALGGLLGSLAARRISAAGAMRGYAIVVAVGAAALGATGVM